MRRAEVLDLADCAEFRQTILARPPRLVRGSLLLFVLLLGSALAWAAVCESDIVVRAPCVVRPMEPVQKVQVPLHGEVEEVRFAEGQKVEFGDVLLRLKTVELDEEFSKLQRAIERKGTELERLSTLHRTLQAEHREALAQAETRIEIAHGELQRAEGEIQLALGALELIEAEVEASQRSVQRQRDLFEHGTISQAELDAFEDALRKERIREESACLKVDEANSDVDLARKRLLASRQERDRLIQTGQARLEEHELRIAEGESELEAMQHDLALLEYDRKRSVVRAPIGGVITEGEMQRGDIVAAGQTVAEIAPPGVRIDAYVGNSDSAGLYEGQKVRVKLDAYDYQKYGELQGEIFYVAPDAERLEPVLAGGVSVYRVKIRPAHDRLGGSARPIELGMTGVAEILTGRERFLALAFRRLEPDMNRE